jgi:hypothetical protein
VYDMRHRPSLEYSDVNQRAKVTGGGRVVQLNKSLNIRCYWYGGFEGIEYLANRRWTMA